ncbi:MAG: RAMP superfamily CRISPR-associated protein [Terriglobia bacterium]
MAEVNRAEDVRPPDSYLPYLLEISGELDVTDFHVGSGAKLSLATDAPVLRDFAGLPYLPASSLRGILRAHVEREAAFLVQEPLKRCAALFGETPSRTDDTISRAGRLRIFDAAPPERLGRHSEVRDHVKIDQKYGAASDTGKFDQEVASSATMRFRLVYEGDSADDRELGLVGEMIRALEAGELSCGAKGGLGYGRLTLTGTGYADFDRRSPEALAAWLGARTGKATPAIRKTFAWHGPDAPPGTESESAQSRLDLEIRIQFEGPVLVRAPIPPAASLKEFDALDRHKDVEKGLVTADQTFVRTGDAETARYYLPASSLRGVLRHQTYRIAATMLGAGGEALVTELFGDVAGGRAVKGRIEICEGRLAGEARPVYLDHVAIDRLTGFAADSKKFSTCGLESPAFTTSIRLRFDARQDRGGEEHARPGLRALALAAFAIRDWMEGMLWCGGATSRGYGYMKSVTITKSTLDWAVQGEDAVPDDFLPDAARNPRPGHSVVSREGPIPWDSWLWSLASAAWRAGLPKKGDGQ